MTSYKSKNVHFVVAVEQVFGLWMMPGLDIGDQTYEWQRISRGFCLWRRFYAYTSAEAKSHLCRFVWQIRCGDLYSDKAVSTFNACAVTEKKCVPQRVDTDVYPVPNPCALDEKFDLSMFQVCFYLRLVYQCVLAPCAPRFIATCTKHSLFFACLLASVFWLADFWRRVLLLTKRLRHCWIWKCQSPMHAPTLWAASFSKPGCP